jgi:cell division septation protein DedD
VKTSAKYIFSFVTFVLFISCSSPEKTVKEKDKRDDTYVFDEVPPEDFYTFETPVEENNEIYVVQIGAFSSFDRAKQFADLSRIELKRDIKVNFNEANNLYVVQIHPPFQLKSEAERYRSELWKIDNYDDAWIIVIKTN